MLCMYVTMPEHQLEEIQPYEASNLGMQVPEQIHTRRNRQTFFCLTERRNIRISDMRFHSFLHQSHNRTAQVVY